MNFKALALTALAAAALVAPAAKADLRGDINAGRVGPTDPCATFLQGAQEFQSAGLKTVVKRGQVFHVTPIGPDCNIDHLGAIGVEYKDGAARKVYHMENGNLVYYAHNPYDHGHGGHPVVIPMKPVF